MRVVREEKITKKIARYFFSALSLAHDSRSPRFHPSSSKYAKNTPVLQAIVVVMRLSLVESNASSYWFIYGPVPMTKSEKTKLTFSLGASEKKKQNKTN